MDVSAYFNDPDGEGLSYAAAVSDTDVVAVSAEAKRRHRRAGTVQGGR